MAPNGSSPQALVVSDEESLSQSIRGLLLQSGCQCPEHAIVPTSLAADRAGRLTPELIVFAVSSGDDLGVLQEIVEEMPSQVMVVGPADDSKFVLRTLHVGATDYVDEQNLANELPEALARFKEHRAAGRGLADSQNGDTSTVGRVVAVLGNGGGCGASTVAVNLAALLARQPGGAGLMDLRLGAGDLASLLDVQPEYTIADLGKHLARLDSKMFGQMLARHKSGVHLLAAPQRFTHISHVTDKAVRQAVLLARRRFRHVVLDVNNAFAPEQLEALWQADVLFLVLRLDYTSLRNARRSMQNLLDVGLARFRHFEIFLTADPLVF